MVPKMNWGMGKDFSGSAEERRKAPSRSSEAQGLGLSQPFLETKASPDRQPPTASKMRRIQDP